MINLDLAKRVIRECADLGLKKICYHMNGEPLLYPHLVELVKLAKDLGYTYIFLTTNGTVGSEELLSDLFEAGLRYWRNKYEFSIPYKVSALF